MGHRGRESAGAGIVPSICPKTAMAQSQPGNESGASVKTLKCSRVEHFGHWKSVRVPYLLQRVNEAARASELDAGVARLGFHEGRGR